MGIPGSLGSPSPPPLQSTGRLPGLARLGLGGWGVGGAGWGRPPDEARREAAVVRALERGIRFFDTAPTYGESERLLGKVVGPRRDEVYLATKVGPRDEPRRSLEASLGRLRTDRVDLLQMHEVGERFEWALEELARLRDAGRVVEIGLCNATPRQLARALELVPLASYQGPYNPFDREVEQRHLPLCRDRGLAFLAYRPLASGLLAGRFEGFEEGDHRRRIWWFRGRELERRREAVRRLGELAAELGLPLPALALAWGMARPGVSVVLAGARTPEQVDQNCDALGRDLTPEEVAEVDRVVADAAPLPRATGRARHLAERWGQRERFIVERLDGRTSPEAIAAEWTDLHDSAMIAAQVRVFADALADQGLVTFG